MINYNMRGADLGSMAEVGGTVYMMFGDNSGFASIPHDKDNLVKRSNALAFSNVSDPANGFPFSGMILTNTPLPNSAKAMIPTVSGLDYVERTAIPTGGVAHNNVLYYAYMAIYKWGRGSHWDTNVTRLAKSNATFDTFTRLNTSGKPLWPPHSYFAQIAMAKDPNSDMLYLFGSPAGAFGGVQVARVDIDDIETFSAYTYYSGTGWSGNRNDAVLVVPPPVREFSVQFSAFLNWWVMLATNDNTWDIELRDAPNPWGPWSNPVTAVDHTSAIARYTTPAGQTKYSYIYGGYMTPKFMSNASDPWIYFAMTKWGLYQVFWERIKLEK